MRYFKKKDILERLGKDGKDIRYLERAIARGEVIEEGGRWSIANEEDNEVEYLRERVKELEKELEKSDQPNAKNFEDTAEIIKLREEIDRLREENEKLKGKSEFNPSELEEALANAEFYRDSYDKLLEDRRNRLEKGFKWFKANPTKVKAVSFEPWYKWVLSNDDYLGD